MSYAFLRIYGRDFHLQFCHQQIQNNNNMKNRIGIFILLVLGTFNRITAQESVKYEILYNNPQDYIPKLNINLDIMQLDFSLRNIDGSAFNIGTYGMFQPAEKLGVNFSVRKSWLLLGKLANENYWGNLDLQAGAFILPAKKLKTVRVQVNLKTERGTYNGNDVEKTTFIRVPANRLVYKGFRGGLMMKRGGFGFREIDKDDVLAADFSNNMNLGIYAGLMYRKLTNLVIKTEAYGIKGHSIGTDFYLDGTFHPVNNFSRLPNNPLATDKEFDKQIKDLTKQMPFGFRLGYVVYQIAPKKVTGKKFGVSGTAEVGYRPYAGWFMNAGVGITFIKK